LVVSSALSAPLAAITFRHACHSHANPHLSATQRSAESHSGHIAGSTRSCRRPIGLHQRDRLALCAAWIGVVSELGTHGARRPLGLNQWRLNERPFSSARTRSIQAPFSAACSACACQAVNGERGLEVSLRSFRQDELIQRQIRNSLAHSLILFLKTLQFLQLVRAHSTVLFLPAANVCLVTPIWRIASRRGIPCPVRTSTCRNFVTISSGFGRLLALVFLRFPKHSEGPPQWGKTSFAQCSFATRPAT